MEEVENKPKRSKRKFSDEFKKEAIELASTIGITKASKELDLHHSQIRNWKSKLEASGASKAKSYSELEKDYNHVKKELTYLKEINKVLKKSTAIFSKDVLGNLK